jgi:hypothetical protein
MAAMLVGVGRQLVLHGRQRLRLGHIGYRKLVAETVDRCTERGECFEQHLAVLPRGDLPGGQRASVAGPNDLKVHGMPGVAGPQVVHVHAVRCPSRRGTTRRHQGLPGDVAADDVVAGVVQLGGHEAVVVDLVDLQCGDDVGQRRRSEAHPGIMPQRQPSPSLPETRSERILLLKLHE